MRDRVIAAVGDQYEIQAEIGRGGMAVVYRAMDLRLRRKIALKVLPPEFAFREDVRRRFQREAEMAARLSHPNIVPIYAVDERGGIVYFVMALVEGESLASLLARTPRLPVPAARRILHDVADALYYAHQHGVIHRDIKPDNILLDAESGRPMVSDFGIARAAETDGQLTVTGVAVGTPAYMSPEQSLGERELDGRSDIYSLGVVGYQMLAGELPFKASNTPAMMMKHVSTIPLPLRERRADAPAALAAAIDRSLAKRPDDRWPTAAAFRDAIDARDVDVESWRHPVGDAREAQLVPVAPPAARDPYEAARAGAREIVRAVLVPPSVPPLPVPALQYPLSRQERRRLRREGFEDLIQNFRQRPLHERIMRFRATLVSTVTTIGVLTTVNILTYRHFPWVVFPAFFLSMGLWRQWTRLWAEGVTWSQVWGPQAAKNIAAARAATAQNVAAGAGPAPAIAPPDADAVASARARRSARHGRASCRVRSRDGARGRRLARQGRPRSYSRRGPDGERARGARRVGGAAAHRSRRGCIAAQDDRARRAHREGEVRTGEQPRSRPAPRPAGAPAHLAHRTRHTARAARRPARERGDRAAEPQVRSAQAAVVGCAVGDRRRDERDDRSTRAVEGDRARARGRG
jgi:predicted Ser/Thr protein kinase